VGAACGLLGETDVAGRLGGTARSDRSLGFVKLRIRENGQNGRIWRRGYAYEAAENIE
jgi:hypothetical protein